MPKKSKKRSRQAKRRAERRETKQPELSDPRPGELLLRRIRTEAWGRHEADARRAEEAEADERRRSERARARGKA